MKLSPIASLYSAGAVLMSACCKYRLVDGLRKSKVTMSYRAVMKGKEYWRVGTSMLLFDLDNPLDIYTLVALFMSLSAIEERFFKGSPTGMISTLAFIAAALLLPGFSVRELRVKEPSVMVFIAIVTWATFRCFFRPTAGIGGRTMPSVLANLIPLAVPHFRKGEIDVPLLKHQGMAVAVGLACCLLIPDTDGARALRQERQRAARRRVREADSRARKGAPAPVEDDSSSEEEEDSSEGEESD